MTDTPESVRKAVQDYAVYVATHHGIGAELLAIGRNYAALLERIGKAPRATVYASLAGGTLRDFDPEMLRIDQQARRTGAGMKDPKTGLLPCPFCGCKFMDTNNESGIFRDFEYGGEIHAGGCGFIARCGNPECGAEIVASTLNKARAQWNRRTL